MQFTDKIVQILAAISKWILELQTGFCVFCPVLSRRISKASKSLVTPSISTILSDTAPIQTRPIRRRGGNSRNAGDNGPRSPTRRKIFPIKQNAKAMAASMLFDAAARTVENPA
jgi:hypothetical protein